MEATASYYTLTCISAARINAPQTCVICTEPVPVTDAEVVLLYCSCSQLIHVPCADAFKASSTIPKRGRRLWVACPLCRRDAEMVIIRRNAADPENPFLINSIVQPPPKPAEEDDADLAEHNEVLAAATGVSDGDDSDYDADQVSVTDEDESGASEGDASYDARSLFEETASATGNTKGKTSSDEDSSTSESSTTKRKNAKRLKRCKTRLVTGNLQAET